jgi:hypothetical protein
VATCFGLIRPSSDQHSEIWGIARLKTDGTRWRTGGEVRGNWRMEWVASNLTLPRNVVYPALLPLMRTPRLPVVDWTDAPADLNGLVRFTERRNMVSARMPSHFKWAVQSVNIINYGGLWGLTYNWVVIAYLQQQCHNSKCVIFQERLLKVLKSCNFLWVQRRHNCSPAASFTNYVMTLYLLKVHLQTFLSITITKKFQALSCDTLVANEWYVSVVAYVRVFDYPRLV